jgi:hypothetical protein
MACRGSSSRPAQDRPQTGDATIVTDPMNILRAAAFSQAAARGEVGAPQLGSLTVRSRARKGLTCNPASE